jgi:hypothetical protein
MPHKLRELNFQNSCKYYKDLTVITNASSLTLSNLRQTFGLRLDTSDSEALTGGIAFLMNG